MKKMLVEYLHRMQPVGNLIDEDTGHRIASVLLAFDMGMYDRAIEQCNALLAITDKNAPAIVISAIRIISEQAKEQSGLPLRFKSEYNLEGKAEIQQSGYKGENKIKHYSFEPEQRDFFAIKIPDEKIEGQEGFEQDNALILLYAVAIISSPYDEQALEERLGKLVLHKMRFYLKDA